MLHCGNGEVCRNGEVLNFGNLKKKSRTRFISMFEANYR